MRRVRPRETEPGHDAEDGELTRSMVLFATWVSAAAYAEGSVLRSEKKSAV
jgi:hypothetical protein